MEELTEFKSYLIAKGYSTTTTDKIIKNIIIFKEWLTTSQTELETISYNDVTAYIKQVFCLFKCKANEKQMISF